MKKLFVFLLLLGVLSTLSVKAQELLKANAGENQHYCFETDWNGATLGGNPTASGGLPPYTYRWWSNPDHPIFLDNGATQANPNVLFLAGFIAYVEVTDAVNNTAIDSVIFTVSKLPYFFPLPLTAFPITHCISQGDSVWITLDNIIRIGESYTTCRWETVPVSANYNICSGFWVKPDVTTSYYLTVTDEHGCSEQVMTYSLEPIYKIYVDKVGIKDYDISTTPIEQILIFPNPTNETLHFTADVDCEIIDIQGRVLLQSKNAVNFIDISCLKAGIYFVKMSNQVIKFIKE